MSSARYEHRRQSLFHPYDKPQPTKGGKQRELTTHQAAKTIRYADVQAEVHALRRELDR